MLENANSIRDPWFPEIIYNLTKPRELCAVKSQAVGGVGETVKWSWIEKERIMQVKNLRKVLEKSIEHHSSPIGRWAVGQEISTDRW